MTTDTTHIKTLAEALPLEMARIRDEVMPAYQSIGTPGAFALAMMRHELDAATKAIMEGDTFYNGVHTSERRVKAALTAALPAIRLRLLAAK